ncbi:MAG TPA: hypothetical protein V6C86_17450 [Oculatellaceae cyanobacterium]
MGNSRINIPEPIMELPPPPVPAHEVNVPPDSVNSYRNGFIPGGNPHLVQQILGSGQPLPAGSQPGKDVCPPSSQPANQTDEHPRVTLSWIAEAQKAAGASKVKALRDRLVGENQPGALGEVLQQTDLSDYKHSLMSADIKKLVAQREANPLVMTQIYDTVMGDSRFTVSSMDDASSAASKTKSLMLLQQAQGEIIIANGMTSSQLQKLENSNAQVIDNPEHRETWAIAPSEKIDIGGQGSKALIRALGSANLTKAYLSAQGNTHEISEVEQQRQDIKKQLDFQFDSPHTQSLANALLNKSWRREGSNAFNLPQLWESAPSNYYQMYHLVLAEAEQNESRLGALAVRLADQQSEFKTAQSEGSSTSIAMKEQFVQARSDALSYVTAFTAKLYRDAALMQLGIAQSESNQAKDLQNIPDHLKLADEALKHAAKVAPNNADLLQLESMSASMRKLYDKDPGAENR